MVLSGERCDVEIPKRIKHKGKSTEVRIGVDDYINANVSLTRSKSTKRKAVAAEVKSSFALVTLYLDEERCVMQHTLAETGILCKSQVRPRKNSTKGTTQVR